MKISISAAAAKIPNSAPKVLHVSLSTGTEIVDVQRTGTRAEMLCGIGSAELDAPLAIAIVHKLVRRARAEGFKTLVLEFGQFKKLFKLSDYETGHRLAEALIVAGYDFNTYKTVPKDGFPGVTQAYVEYVPSTGERGLKEGAVVAEYTNHARDLANTSAKDMTPEKFAAAIKALAPSKVKVSVLKAPELKKLHMDLLLAVGGAAAVPPCVVIAEYNGGKKGEAPIALVGKTITYDTGGLSLKTGDYMLGMQRDMTGGATVMAATFAAATLGLKKNVVAIAAVAENAIGPNAYRPGDVLNSMAGITVENGNSDAEGRLVLADGIYYAGTKFKPSLLIDVATLTGAAHVALGDHHSGLFTTDRALEDEFRKMGEDTGNYLAPLPLRPSMHEPYIKSSIADVASIRMDGSRYGGATVAAMFLHKFAVAAGIKKHVHLDIASRMDVPKGSDLAGPSLGEPVPLLVQAIREF